MDEISFQDGVIDKEERAFIPLRRRPSLWRVRSQPNTSVQGHCILASHKVSMQEMMCRFCWNFAQFQAQNTNEPISECPWQFIRQDLVLQLSRTPIFSQRFTMRQTPETHLARHGVPQKQLKQQWAPIYLISCSAKNTSLTTWGAHPISQKAIERQKNLWWQADHGEVGQIWAKRGLFSNTKHIRKRTLA